MIVNLLPEHHLEFLSLKGGCRGSPEFTLVKMSNCWKSHALAHFKKEELTESLARLELEQDEDEDDDLYAELESEFSLSRTCF